MSGTPGGSEVRMKYCTFKNREKCRVGWGVGVGGDDMSLVFKEQI